MSVTFSHLDPGTPEETWRNALTERDIRPLDLPIHDLVVLAAHPDDETLGAAGLIRQVHNAGGRVTVIIATDGEASHPDSPTHSRSALAARRRREVIAATTALAPLAQVHFLAIPDGMLQENSADLATSIADILDARPVGIRRPLVVAPWSGDRHRDHRILAETAARVCAERGLAQYGYPIWAWHWGAPADLPWDSARAVVMSDEERAAKALAIDAHASQTAPLSPAPGDEAVVHAGMRAHFDRAIEVFFDETGHRGEDVESLTADWFSDFYRRNDDPWGFETRWYEERKRDLLLAALPDERLGAVLEVGCSTGLITARLRDRAERVVALDPVLDALATAQARIGADDRVVFVCGQVPDAWPEGQFDTIVLSEVLYYLSRDDLARTVALAERALAPGGSLVACHWRHPVPEYPLTGDDVHDALRARPGWGSVVRHEEKDFVLEVFSGGPVRSVAEREGLA